jgi:hypothetical protein
MAALERIRLAAKMAYCPMTLLIIISSLRVDVRFDPDCVAKLGRFWQRDGFQYWSTCDVSPLRAFGGALDA